MSYILYGDLGSGAFSAEAALAEAGAQYSFQIVSLQKNAQREPDYLAINPSGKMPALKLPSGKIVTESIAILLAVDDRHPEAALLPPPGSMSRAQCCRWLAFMASEVYPMVEICDYPERFVPKDQSEALRGRARERIRERLLAVEQNLQGPWMLSTGFCAADIYIAMFTRWRNDIGKEWLAEGHIPKIMALADAVSGRPKIAPVWRKHFPRG